MRGFGWFRGPLLSMMLVAAGGWLGCDGDDGSPDTYSGEPTVLDGTWLQTWEDASGDAQSQIAVLFEVSGAHYQITFFSDTLQEGGFKGTFEVDADRGVLLASQTHAWDEDSRNWKPEASEEEVGYVRDGDSLTLTPPEIAPFLLSRTVFSVRPELVATWYEIEPYDGVLELDADGTFRYTAVGYEQSGPSWQASDQFIRSVVTSDTEMGQGIEMSFFNAYEMPAPDTLHLAINEAGVQVYSTTEP